MLNGLKNSKKEKKKWKQKEQKNLYAKSVTSLVVKKVIMKNIF
jgi:hypothetical protein